MCHHPDSSRKLVILMARVTAHLLQESSRLEEAEAGLVLVQNYAEVVTEWPPPGAGWHHVRHTAARLHRHWNWRFNKGLGLCKMKDFLDELKSLQKDIRTIQESKISDGLKILRFCRVKVRLPSSTDQRPWQEEVNWPWDMAIWWLMSSYRKHW